MKNKPAALIITYDYFVHTSGVTRIVRSLESLLISQGWKVHILTHDDHNSITDKPRSKIFSYNSSQTIKYSTPVGDYLSAAYRVLATTEALHKKHHYRLIYAHHYIAGPTLLKFKQLPDVKTMFTCHGIRKNHFSCYNHFDSNKFHNLHDAWEAGSQAAMTEAMHILEELSICNADVVSCVSKNVANDIRSYWPSIKPKIIENFYCLDDHRCQRISSFKTKAKDKISIIFVGRWEKTKGADIVTQIANKLSKEKKYIFFHAGNLIDIPLCDNIVHLGHLRDPQLAWLYKNVDLLLMPSRYEPFGLSAIEAICNGTPVLGYSIGGLKDILKNKENGWIMNTLDPDRWITTIHNLFSKGTINKMNRNKMSIINRDTYNSQKPLNKYKKIIDGFLV
ncbi:MAG: glycosyltransferase family 4 protein [Bacteroidota bacterium]|jgi:glycosyltransferase involved in cell wall biosynthesis